MHDEIVSFFRWFYSDRHSYFCKGASHDASIVSTVCCLFSHIKIKCRTDRAYETRSTVRWITIIVSISDIFYGCSSIFYNTYYSTIRKPLTDNRKVIITISRVSFMVILSFPFGKYLIPTLCSDIESAIKRKRWKTRICTLCIVPSKPSISYLIYIHSWYVFSVPSTSIRNMRRNSWSYWGIYFYCITHL